jgi:hypothetical protein
MSHMDFKDFQTFCDFYKRIQYTVVAYVRIQT